MVKKYLRHCHFVVVIVWRTRAGGDESSKCRRKLQSGRCCIRKSTRVKAL